eukprot:scaffold31853_cov19-Prasinocladus_malaysianus.AAC.1
MSPKVRHMCLAYESSYISVDASRVSQSQLQACGSGRTMEDVEGFQSSMGNFLLILDLSMLHLRDRYPSLAGSGQ